MRALVTGLLLSAAALADDRNRILGFVDAALELPAPVRERPRVKVRIEPAPARPKSSSHNSENGGRRGCP